MVLRGRWYDWEAPAGLLRSLQAFAVVPPDHGAGGDDNRSSCRQVPSTGRREPGEHFLGRLAESGPPILVALHRQETEAQRGGETGLESHSDVWSQQDLNPGDAAAPRPEDGSGNGAGNDQFLWNP